MLSIVRITLWADMERVVCGTVYNLLERVTGDHIRVMDLYSNHRRNEISSRNDTMMQSVDQR